MQTHQLTEGAYLLESAQGCALFGCPPEMLKLIRQKGLNMPDTIILPETLFAGHSSQAAVEFFLYDFLFVQQGLAQGRKLRVITLPGQQAKLAEMLRVTLIGPDYAEMVAAGQKPEWAKQIYAETTHLAVKNGQGEVMAINDFIEWQSLSVGDYINLWPDKSNGKAPVSLERLSGSSFTLTSGDIEKSLDLQVGQQQKPCYSIQHDKVNQQQLGASVTILGSSDGFDPHHGSNGCLFNFAGRLGIWDCPPYLNQHLEAMGLTLSQIEAMFISHVHDDHLDVVETLCKEKPLDLYCTAEVQYSMLIKLAAVLGCTVEEAKQYHHWHIVEVEQSFSALGAEFQFFYSVHSIPSVGCRITVPDGVDHKKILISGDSLPLSGVETMKEAGVLPDARYQEAVNLIEGDEDIILIDAGGGMIHGDYRDYLHLENRIYFYHTSKIEESSLDDSKYQVKQGQILS